MFNALSRSLLMLLVLTTLTSLTALAQTPAAEFQTLHSFAGGPADGAYPSQALVFSKAGDLFGATIDGGSNTSECYGYGCGGMFELQPKSGKWKESLPYSFSASSSEFLNPEGTIVLDSHGNVYGTQSLGGDPDCQCGVVYELSRIGGVWTEIILHTFTGGTADGQYPNSGLIADSAGNLYGVTESGGEYDGGGTFFELSPNGDGGFTYNIIYQFGQSSGYDAQDPSGPLSMDSQGNIYGTSASGGSYGYGAVFKLSPSNGSWTESVLFNLTIDYGNYPNPWGVVPDSAGNLYGTATDGGPYGVGTVYKLTPQTGFWKRTILYTFSGSGDGAYPFGLAISSSGTLYGAADSGGSFGYGNVYQIQSVNGKWMQSVLHEFTNGTDGEHPFGNLIFDSQGNLYGTAQSGGTYGFGTVFEITP